ncbi:MAG: hypothetical protein HOM14_19310 [Gammaproteobacteria bacterium]|jgi:hypothetical protein|nr:hypothetical protein [Gammaproteobacteria bacterium]MBT3722561.1 hypothetical protein [Gammaproteobacteria bacterium]MBT4196988.1 hypothetical protein [Gammaproteobacteria bacterium]MBT4451844.1 hypothetical protein [Gammaproteobacteria bacterium]MBT4860756.1 hypothetical protein [Gammaproteobacteria bacterium]
MVRGGKRNKAGRKTTWNTDGTGTATIRLPADLAKCLSMAKENQLPVNQIIMAIESVTQSKDIKLPGTKRDYILLIEHLKQSGQWQVKNNKLQNVARI